MPPRMWGNKEDVVHIYNRILLSHKKETGSFAEMWMDLETVIQSEVGQKEKNRVQKYTCTPMFIATLFTITKTWKQPKVQLLEMS